MSLEQFLQHLMGVVSGNAFLYRGESQEYPCVSSGLWRSLGQPHPIFVEESIVPSIGEIAENMLRKVLKATDDQDPVRVQTEMQHYGGKTNLIDFTRDINIALFFASIAYDNKHGQIVLLRCPMGFYTPPTLDYRIIEPTSPRHMIAVQKSVLVEPQNPILSESNLRFVRVPKELKPQIIRHMEKLHGITLESVYNDLSAFTRDPNLMLDTSTLYQFGVVSFFGGNYEKAIESLTAAISRHDGKLPARSGHVYFHRGLAYWCLGRKDEAMEDLRSFMRRGMSDKEHYIDEVREALPSDVFRLLEEWNEEDVQEYDNDHYEISDADDSKGSRIKVQADISEGGLAFLVVSGSGFKYEQTVSSDEMVVNIPANLGSVPCHVWLCKDSYQGMHEMPIRIGHEYSVTLSPFDWPFPKPVPTLQPIKVKMEWKPQSE